MCVLVHLLCSKGWSLRYLPGWGYPLCCIVALPVGQGPEREQCCLLGSRPAFSYSPTPIYKQMGPSGADSQVDGFVYILGPCGSLQQAVLQGWEFLPPPQVPQVFTVKGIEAFFPCAGTLGCTVCLASQLFLSIYLHTDVGPPSLPATTLTCILSAPPPV